MLELRDLRSGYGKLEIIHGVSLALESGSVYALIGVNGAGKTTLLKTIVGLVATRSGDVELDGVAITNRPTAEISRAGVTLVPEGRDVFPGLSVRENIMLGAYAARDKAPDGLEQMLELFPELARRQSQAAGSLSGGEQQMLAIARALICDPKVLLLDEPSLGLGPMVVQTLFDVVDRFRGLGTSILLVEQNVKVSLAVADTAAVLERGEIVLEGPARELADDPRVSDFYLGSLGELEPGRT